MGRVGQPAAEPETVEVHAVGSEVLLDGKIGARVTEVRLYGPGMVGYQCVWWDEHGRHEEMLESWEVLPDGDRTRKTRVSQIL